MSACVKDYPTPAPNVDAIRMAPLNGRHLIILNKSGHNNVIQIGGKCSALLGGITLVQPHIGGDPVFQKRN